MRDLGVTCVFTEPQSNPELVNTVFENSTAKTIDTIDPIGANFAPSKNQYLSLVLLFIFQYRYCKPPLKSSSA
ncbi:high-affinity zinc uptake system protein ZnuA2 [Vibrio cholerae]|nr:high-affinity zinc uptake system protein ZnuA2 [Vibrio cholerae]